MLKMDGIVLKETDLKSYYDYAEEKITLAELDEMERSKSILSQ